MSRIKNLRNEFENCINLVDLFSLICPEGKSKYIELGLRLMKKTKRIDEYGEEVKTILETKFGIDRQKLNKFTSIQVLLFCKIFDDYFSEGDIIKFKKFCELNERGLVEKNDLSSYDSIQQIIDQLTIAEMKSVEKEMEKQILKLHDDGEWIVVRPLTYEASKRYGSNTKWCTTMEDKSYFRKYAGRGILIYVINKKTGLKVASYRSIQDVEFSFWNQIDERIDSLQSKLPKHILDVILEEIETNFVSNLTLIGEKYEEENFKSYPMIDEPIAMVPDFGNEIEEEEISQEEPMVERNVYTSEEDMFALRRLVDHRINENIERVYTQQEIPFPETNNRA